MALDGIGLSRYIVGDERPDSAVALARFAIENDPTVLFYSRD